MDRRDLPQVSRPHVSSGPLSPAYDRRLGDGLGRGTPSTLRLRDLARFIPFLLNELAGTSSSISFSSTLSSPSSGSLRPTFLGQHHGDFLHSSSRHVTLRSSHASLHADSGVLQGSLHLSHSKTPQRVSECDGRSELSPEPDLHGMDIGSEDVRLGLLSDASSTGGPLRHQGQPPSSLLCLPLSGPGGSGGECDVDPLEPMGIDLPVSSSSPASESLLSASPIQGSGSIGRSLLCTVKLAPQPSSQVSVPHPATIRPFPVAEDQQRPCLPPRSFCISPSRVETIRMGLLAAGFNEAAADVYLRSHRPSSTKQYQSVWRKFLSFISRNGFSFQDTSVGTVCNFLTYESTINNLQYRTISGYRSALKHPLFWSCGLDIKTVASSQFLRGLFNLKPPVRSAPMPIWNLNILLSFLDSDRFEPLSSASVTSVTQKTLCLLLLASGRRISEIAFISRSHQTFRRGTLSLDWVPSFRPKHDDQSFRPPSPSIFPLASDLSSNLSLCPIRAYRFYHSLSQSWLDSRPAHIRREFFWAHPGSPHPLSIRQLSKLFVDVVKDALLDAGLPVTFSIGPHQMRKLSASHSRNVGHDENLIQRVMGFSSLSILRKNYIAAVPPLRIACVLPGGPFFPKVDNVLSESDSDSDSDSD